MLNHDIIYNKMKHGGREKSLPPCYYSNKISQVLQNLFIAYQTSFTASDAAILFYKQESGVPGTSIIEGNSSDWDAEIDKMIATAKERQTNE